MQIKQTKKLESVLLGGCYEARRRSSSEVTTDHLFLAILKQEESHASHVLRKLLKNWEIDQIKTRLEREMGPVVAQDGRSQALRQTIAINGESMLRQIISDAGKGCVVERMLNTGHLLRAILDDRSSISSRILALYNVTGETAAPFMKDLPPNEDYYENMRFLSLLGDDEGEHPERLFSGVMRIGAPAGDKPKDSMLDQFGVDLTRCAAEGKLDPVIGREAEIERVIQILGRRKKNNPVLIGEAGVGKSAIVEGLALRIVQKSVPHVLLHKRIFSLDVSSLVAGTKYRGQFEERINALLKELSGSDVILFIDEIHTIVGAGSTQGSLDTANILKPALARGELQCIGATTMNEYRENIEADSALERRFQKIVVEQPSAEQTLHMLRNIRSQYESHHCVRYTDEALSACVGLTRRYVTDRFFPDKAIDVMDEAGSRARAFDAQVPESLKLLEQEIEQAAGEKNRAIKMQNYELAATLRNREGALRLRLQEVEKQWRENMARSPIEVGETVRFGYYSQQGLEFDEGKRVIDVVTEIAEQIDLGDGRRMSASQFLQHFLFTPETQYSFVARLSGGERRRLYLCTVLMRNPNFLILDEPTNDLDIVTLQVLEEYLQGFGGCLIVVSHDRYFMNKVVDHLLVFEGEGRIRDFPGNYDEYLEWKQLRDAELRTRHDAESGTVPVPKRPARNDKRRLSFNEKRELERLEKEIPELEARKAELEQSLCSGTLPIDELTHRSVEVSELIGRIDELSMRWLELSEIGE